MTKTRSRKHVQESVARLRAVQLTFDRLYSHEKVAVLLPHFMNERAVSETEADHIESPDKELFSRVAQGVAEQEEMLNDMVNQAYGRNHPGKEPEKLLRAVMLCAAFELWGHPKFDAALIIDEYLDITHAFYDKGQVGLVNGVLDQLNKAIRHT